MGERGMVFTSRIQNKMVNVDKPKMGTNLSELLKNVISVDNGGQTVQSPSSSLSCLSSGLGNLNTLSEMTTMSRNIKDEMWRAIVNQEQAAGFNFGNGGFRVGKTTQEHFLMQDHNAHQIGGVDPTTLVSRWAEWLPPQEQMMAMDTSFSISGDGKRHYSEEMMQETMERKQRRMIKNRESAARSRVRKQAYTTQLEIEVKDLGERNHRLKKQKEMEMKLLSESNREMVHQLRRTSSAPF